MWRCNIPCWPVDARKPRRYDLRLEGGGQLFRLFETKTEVGQARLLIAFDACDLDRHRFPGLQLRHQLDPPHQLRHRLTLVS